MKEKKMKYSIILTVFLLFTVTVLNAQPFTIQVIFDKYSEKEGFTIVNLNNPSDLIGNEIDSESKEAIKNIESIKIITAEKNDGKPSDNFFESFTKDLKNVAIGQDYANFLSVNSDDEYVRMVYKKNETNGDVNEFIIIVSSDDEGVLVWIKGVMNLKDLKKIGKTIQKSGDIIK